MVVTIVNLINNHDGCKFKVNDDALEATVNPKSKINFYCD